MTANEVTERAAALSESERAEIRKTIRNYWFAMLIIVVAIGLFAATIGGFRTIGGIIVSTIFIGLAAIAVLFCYVSKSVTSRDLKANQKKIITGPVEEKRMGTLRTDPTSRKRQTQVNMVFHLTLNGKEYFAPDHIYLALRQGDFVELHILPKSEKILKWSILKDKDGVNLTNSAATTGE